MTKAATCNECGSEIWFDSYADINGVVVTQFPEWVCSGCDNRGKFENSGSGYTVKETS